ncbi:hypothetical protein C8R44DRAFT_859920 [Mycena epipterygia]|nr:hypothetical protein C8R44DRAFT_859920 [Mycena epipterygia]
MGTQSLLSGLPVELIGLIAELSAPTDVVALCQTNRWIHSVCFRYVYHSVALDNLPDIVKCLRTLVSNTGYAQEVRALKLECYPRSTFRSFGALLQATMMHLRNLENLFAHVSPDLFASLSEARFPRLRECSIPFGRHTDPFLLSHSGIHSLLVLPTDEEQLEYMPSVPRISMPDLQTFFGPEALALMVIPHSRVSHLFICWNPHRSLLRGYADEISTLALSSTPILLSDNVIRTWDTSLLSAIAASMPHLTTLNFRNPCPSGSHQLQAFISHMDTVLATLPSLTIIAITQDPLRSESIDSDELEGEFQVVRRWSNISSTLKCAILPSETAWGHLKFSVWYPAARFPTTPNLLLRNAWYLRRVACSPDLCSDYSAVAELLVGSDAFYLVRDAFEREGYLPDFELTSAADGMVTVSFADPSFAI